MARAVKNYLKLAFLCLLVIIGHCAVAQKNISTTRLVLGPEVALKGDTVTFAATVTGVNPGGEVIFYDYQGIEVGRSILTNGVATFSKAHSTLGIFKYYAKYVGDDLNDVSMSVAVPLDVSDYVGATLQTPSKILAPNQPFTITIPSFGSATTATLSSNIDFVGTIVAANGNTVQSPGYAVGPIWIATSYTGGQFGLGASKFLKLNINRDPVALTNTEVSIYSATSPLKFNDYVTLKAQVLGKNPTGTVKFSSSSGVPFGSATLVNGIATYTAYKQLTGIEYGPTFTAEYSGDAQNTPARGTSMNYKTVPLFDLTFSKSQVAIAENVTLTLTLKGYYPTGTVQFIDGTTTLASVPLTSGSVTSTATFVTSFPKSSIRKIYAVYTGNQSFTSIVTPVAFLTVGTGKADTAVALSSNPAVAFVGQDVWLNASIAGDNPSGSIQFQDGASPLGNAPLTSNLASLSVKWNTAGVHSLTAVYPGDSGNASSTSNLLSFTVKDKTVTTTSLSLTPNPSYSGQNITLTAAVNGGTPSGKISFFDGSTLLSKKVISNGSAAYSTASLSEGMHALSASYEGDSGHTQSQSSAVSQKVQPKNSSSVALTVTPQSGLLGQELILSTSVSGLSPTGTVTFSAGPWTLGAANVNQGKATLIKSDATYLNVGSNNISAVYSGDDANNWSLAFTDVVLKDGSLMPDNYVVYSEDINKDGCSDYLVRTRDGSIVPIFVLVSGAGCNYTLVQPDATTLSANWQPTTYKVLVGNVIGDSEGSLLLVPQSSAALPIFNVRKLVGARNYAYLQSFEASKFFSDPSGITLSLVDVDNDARTDLTVSSSKGVINVFGAMPDGKFDFDSTRNRSKAAKFVWKNFLTQTNSGSVDGALTYVSESIRSYIRTAMTVSGADIKTFAGTVKQFEILMGDGSNQVRAAVVFDGIDGGSDEMFVITFGQDEGDVWRLTSM